MESSIRIASKGIMMGAAITFTAIRHEYTFYNCVTLGLFSLSTVAHIVMSLGVTTLLLYLLLATVPSILTIVAVSQAQCISVLEYAPVIIAFMLWIIEDFSRLHASCLLPSWTNNIHGERCTPYTPPIMAHESTQGFRGSVVPDYGVDDDVSIMSAQDSLLLRYMWSPSQSCAPSSRLSDISLSSGGPESLPSSWGTLTRIWFPDFSAQGQSFDEPGQTGCRRARTV
ncbi:hypothetical protein F5X98DRAFT_380998 [Xylaria grammica]|nr:hypothetical protein F5X98DRAFT_380998 [Xylaria grammica]